MCLALDRSGRALVFLAGVALAGPVDARDQQQDAQRGGAVDPRLAGNAA